MRESRTRRRFLRTGGTDRLLDAEARPDGCGTPSPVDGLAESARVDVNAGGDPCVAERT